MQASRANFFLLKDYQEFGIEASNLLQSYTFMFIIYPIFLIRGQDQSTPRIERTVRSL